MMAMTPAKIFPRTYRFFLARYSATLDPDFTRARLLLSFVMISSVISLVFFIAYQFFNTNIPTYIYLFTPFFLFVIAFLLRTPISLNILSNILLVFYWIIFSVGVYFSGGIHSVVLPWLALLPFVANVFNNYSHAIVWFVVITVTILLFALQDHHIPIIAFSDDPWRALISYIGLASLLFFFTTFYHNTQIRFITLLKERNNMLAENQDELQTQNEALKKQRDVIELQQEQIKQINEQLKEKLNEIERINDVLEEQREILMHLTKCRWIKEGELQGALKEVALLAAKAMGITQVTVWRINDKQDRLEAIMSYNAQASRFSSGISFEVAGYELYYEVLYAEKIVAVEDVFLHDLTRQNVDDYFIPQNIKACMDVPYYIGGNLGGTVSFENHQETRKWSSQDKNFAKALADIVTLAIESAWRREYEEKIREQNETISQINKGLEDRVRRRTEELEQQNEKLAEYAFINSHILRAPLSRVLGLIHLMEMTDKRDPQLIDYLKKSGEELDEVVKKINATLAERADLARKDFR
jgi:GAF domain-containing protein